MLQTLDSGFLPLPQEPHETVMILLALAAGDERRVLAESLRVAGHRVRTAATLADARRALAEDAAPDVLVLDMRLGDEPGLALCSELHAHGAWAHLPVLVVGPGDAPDAEIAAFDAGAADYLPRPLQAQAVAMRLAARVHQAHQAHRLRVAHHNLWMGRQAVEAAAVAIVFVDLQGHIEWANRAFSELTGYTLAEVVGKNPNELVKSGVHGPEFYAELWQTVLAGRVWQGELINRRKNGDLYEEEMTITPVLDEQGRVRRFIAVKRDITERKQMLQDLREVHARLERALVAGNVGLWELDVRANRVHYSDKWQERMGYGEDEVGAAPEDLAALIHPDDREATVAAWKAYLAAPDNGFQQEFRLSHKDGSYRWILAQAKLEKDEQGLPVRLVGSHVDISDHKRLEAQFLQAQRLESMGRLAGGVAHDFNNLLTVIGGYTDLALRRARASGSDLVLVRHLEEIRKAGERAGELTRRLLMVSRQEMVARRAIDLNAVVQEMKPMLDRVIREDIRLIFELDPNLWPVKADTGQMNQVILNLAVNARDAMPEGGRLIFRTANLSLTEAFPTHQGAAPPGDYVCLSVIDEGTGMDAATQARLFEPFFTTKAPGQGTGLGLTTVLTIVEETKGAIVVESAPGRGSTFSIYLPRAVASVVAEPARPPEHVPAAEAAPAKSKTILVAEDGHELRRLICDVLSGMGYAVLAAANGREALRRWEAHHRAGGTVELVITDMIMPELNGRQLVNQMRERNLRAPVLYMSGYSDDAQLHAGVANSTVHFLAKPFGVGDLAAKVRAVLDEER